MLDYFESFTIAGFFQFCSICGSQRNFENQSTHISYLEVFSGTPCKFCFILLKKKHFIINKEVMLCWPDDKKISVCERIFTCWSIGKPQ